MIKTPIQKLNSFKDNEIFVKREDLLPFSFGGNKVRIAEEFFKDMEKKNKNVMVAYGNSRSNLCRILSNMAYQKRIPCVIVSPADDDGKIVKTNNSILVNACETKYINCTKSNVSEVIQRTLDTLEKEGYCPYYIYGNKLGKGNECVPVRAYYEVYKSILKQEKELNIKFDYIFLATGTGMTQAGLICGNLVNSHCKHEIVGISIARKKDIEKNILYNYINAFLNSINQKMNYNDIYKKIHIDDDYIQEGYGVANSDILNEIKKIYVTEGMYLDPTYTGKAFFGMNNYLKVNGIKGKKILFIHTGGVPLFFDNIQHIFKENLNETSKCQ